MKIKTIVAALAISLTIQVNAQWDTVNYYSGTSLKGVAFRDANVGWVCGYNPSTDSGAYGVLGFTYDAGDHWNITWSFQNIGLWDVVYTDSNKVWVVGDSGLVFHFDEFNNFLIERRISPFSLRCGTSPTNNVFFAGGEQGALFRTIDAGNTWDTLSANTNTSETINDIFFTDAANGWLVADGGYVATTSDSGNTWTFVQQPLWGFYDYNSFAFQGTSGTNPYLVGEAGKALSSLDGGNSWYSIATGTTNNLNCVRFGTNNAGLMCGDNGFIYRTDNAAWSWNADNSPSNANLYDIAFADDSTAFICGDSGVVLRSTINISSVEESSSAAISASAFPNPFNGTLFVDVELNNSSPVEIRINDITGKQIRVNTIANATAGHNRIEVSGTEELAAGMYFITITSADAMITLPVVRQ